MSDPREGLSELRRIVDEQAKDGALWFATSNIVEAYLQQELRRLHAAVERATGGETGPSQDLGWMLAKAAEAARAGNDEPGREFSKALREHFKRPPPEAPRSLWAKLQTWLLGVPPADGPPTEGHE